MHEYMVFPPLLGNSRPHLYYVLQVRKRRLRDVKVFACNEEKFKESQDSWSDTLHASPLGQARCGDFMSLQCKSGGSSALSSPLPTSGHLLGQLSLWAVGPSAASRAGTRWGQQYQVAALHLCVPRHQCPRLTPQQTLLDNEAWPPLPLEGDPQSQETKFPWPWLFCVFSQDWDRSNSIQVNAIRMLPETATLRLCIQWESRPRPAKSFWKNHDKISLLVTQRQMETTLLV